MTKPAELAKRNIELSNRRILIVDDTHSIHQDFEKILVVENTNTLEDMEALLFGQELSASAHNSIDFELDSAFQGDEALEKVRRALETNSPYALAFVDVRMPPGWDGIQTIEYLWQVDPHLQIVICTAYSDYSWQETFSRLGNNDNLLILKKPFENIEVLQMANALVHKWNSSMQARMKMNEMEKRVVNRTEKIAQQNIQLENKISELNQTRNQLIQSEKLASIGQLAAGIAHEINNPLGFVHSNLDVLSGYINDLKQMCSVNDTLLESLIKGDNKKTQQKLQELQQLKQSLDINYILNDMPELISEALNGTARVKEIVADLKDYSHMSQQHMGFEDLNVLVEQAVNISNNETKYHVSIVKDLQPMPDVECWRGKLTQVILNLLLNANQTISSKKNFCKNKGTDFKGQIVIATGYDKAIDRAVITLSDNGGGIAEEHLEKIFDPFFTTKEIGKGTGLGLHISHSIITSHGGTITVSSEQDIGTTFTIKLPIKQKVKIKN